MRVTLESAWNQRLSKPDVAIYRYAFENSAGNSATIAEGAEMAEVLSIPLYVPDKIEMAYENILQSRSVRAEARIQAYFLIFLAVIVVPAFGIGLAVSTGESNSHPRIATWGIISVMAASMFYLMRKAQQLLDWRGPIVFLRSHIDDDLQIPKSFFELDLLWRHAPGTQAVKVEEVLADSLYHYGPVTALLGPSEHGIENFREPVFTRAVSSLDDWQSNILQNMLTSRLVVIALGSTQSLKDERFGLAWEIATLRLLDRPSKVLLVVPPIDQLEINKRWAAFGDLSKNIGIGLPSKVPQGGAVCLFDKKWECEIVAEKLATSLQLRECLRNLIHDPDVARWAALRFKVGAVVGGGIALGASYLGGLSLSETLQATFMAAAILGVICYSVRSIA